MAPGHPGELTRIVPFEMVDAALAECGSVQQRIRKLPAHQLIRTAIADATSTVPGADPDRAGFSITLQAARDQVVQAAGIIADNRGAALGARGQPGPGRQSSPARLPGS
ncbi:transposase domain-containing protein [Kitasatospora sp. GP82]|uniref:transposase domain-containing protein n=1 Tax=Kitasatospora sp. GP82 TaxID=3035089 RepID=UPI002476A229|nr:transposase domain-containing protein [Kitasatospora sp. GP82]MDH6126831.1 hypothetical protein [Kitasatospora sp. GP82]